MNYSHQYNESKYNEKTSSVSSAFSSPHSTTKYFLELRDQIGNLIQPLKYYYDGQIEEIVNEPGKITFSYPLEKDESSELNFPNQLWLKNAKYEIIEKYWISPSVTKISSGSESITISGESLIYQLDSEYVINYEDECTIYNHISNFINDNQNNPYPLLYGFIDPAIGNEIVSLKFQGKSILQAIKDLYSSIELGHFWVEPEDKRFYWKIKMGTDIGQTLSFSKNMIGLTVTTHPPFGNKIYVFGKNGLQMSGNAYRSDDESISKYGTFTKIKNFKDVESESLLAKYAEAYLKKYSEPYKNISVDCIALEHAGGEFSFENIKLGNQVRVVCKKLNLDHKDSVVRISRNLDEPIIQSIELSNKIPDLEFSFDYIAEELQKNTSPVPSDEEPEPIINDSTSSAGESTLYARADHTHSINIDDIIDSTSFGSGSVNMDDYYPTENPENISSSSSSKGTSEKFSLEDHTHQGMPLKSDSYSSLGLNNGEIGYATDHNKLYFKEAGSVKSPVVFLGSFISKPSIPDYGVAIFYWAEYESIGGDNQLWIASSEDSEWSPLQKSTSKSG
jgi:phage minor structural protein